MQARPELREEDRLEDLFLLSVRLGFELMKRTVAAALSGDIARTPLRRRGRLFKRDDMTDKAVRRAMDRCRAVLQDYLADRPVRDGRIPLVGPRGWNTQPAA
jgi:hypothetical protein